MMMKMPTAKMLKLRHIMLMVVRGDGNEDGVKGRRYSNKASSKRARGNKGEGESKEMLQLLREW